MAMEKNPNRVLFLDVDGGLKNETWAHEVYAKEGVSVYREDRLEERALLLLKEIIDRTGAVIVVSSAWRRFPDAYEHLTEWLEKYGMSIYDKTPVLDTYRGQEISSWLTHHLDVTNYAILDDLDDMGLLLSHFVHTHYMFGLSKKNVERCVKLLTEGVK